MDWQSISLPDGRLRYCAHYREYDLSVRVVEPLQIEWSVLNGKKEIAHGSTMSLFIAKRRAEDALRPKMKSTGSFSQMRRWCVHDHGTSKPFWYERTEAQHDH
jgi:hypothetical protein